MIGIFKILGGLGVGLISAGILNKKRNVQDVLYILGGVCLGAYSIYIKDLMFIILQIVFISVAICDFVKLQISKNKSL